MSSSPRPRPRRLDGWRTVERWLVRNDPSRWPLVEAALVAIQDDTWADRYHWRDEVTVPGAVLMVVAEDLWVVWRPIAEYPDHYRVIYVGDPDDYDFDG